MSFEGYTKKELKWKESLNTDRQRAFASTACELSRKYEITPQEAINLMDKHYWEVWDISSYIRNLVMNNYPLREKVSV